MALDEKWASIVLSAADTVRGFIQERLGPSKKELIIRVDELNRMVDSLVNQNLQMSSDMAKITQAIIDQLATYYSFTINADTITIIGKNTQSTTVTSLPPQDTTISITPPEEKIEVKSEVEDIFSGIDEEIASTRVKTTSQLEKEYDLSNYLS